MGDPATGTNAHITPEAVSRGLAGLLTEIEDSLEEGVRLSWLGRQKTGADNTTRLLLESLSGTPHAVIIFSRPAAPGLVARAAELAEAVRGLVGDTLGEAIPRPLYTGEFAGLSYKVLPYYRELSRHKLVGIVQRRRLRGPVMDWLALASGTAARAMAEAPAGDDFRVRLEYLAGQEFATGEIKAKIAEQLARLAAGEWRPRHTFDHNDMWIGNLMLPGSTPLGGRIDSRFLLIDWAGANPCGYGIYDVVRMGMAFGMNAQRQRAELRAHCAGLGCDLQDARGHLLASLARLHAHLEHFPEERYLATFGRCWTTLNEALAND